FVIRYEPEACASELPSISYVDEHKRKVRIAAGGFQAIGILKSLLAFWKHPQLSFLYISHRVLRWTLSPICILLVIVLIPVLYVSTSDLIYKVLLYSEVFTLVCFFAGHFSVHLRKHNKI